MSSSVIVPVEILVPDIQDTETVCTLDSDVSESTANSSPTWFNISTMAPIAMSSDDLVAGMQDTETLSTAEILVLEVQRICNVLDPYSNKCKKLLSLKHSVRAT